MITVTITGADDDVDPRELAALSDRFPFVEWGILFSAKRHGTPRYPDAAWLGRLSDATGRPSTMRLSAHLCGEMARDTIGGSPIWLIKPGFGIFQRVQLNGFEPYDKDGGGIPHGLSSLVGILPFEFILQARDHDALRGAGDNAIRLGPRASMLYDPSGGRGVRGAYPERPIGTHAYRVGYAGGIGPDNVEDVVSDCIRHAVRWIDMESGVRTDDRFDVAKVREVLERAQRAGAGA